MYSILLIYCTTAEQHDKPSKNRIWLPTIEVRSGLQPLQRPVIYKWPFSALWVSDDGRGRAQFHPSHVSHFERHTGTHTFPSVQS